MGHKDFPSFHSSTPKPLVGLYGSEDYINQVLTSLVRYRGSRVFNVISLMRTDGTLNIVPKKNKKNGLKESVNDKGDASEDEGVSTGCNKGLPQGLLKADWISKWCLYSCEVDYVLFITQDLLVVSCICLCLHLFCLLLFCSTNSLSAIPSFAILFTYIAWCSGLK